MKTARIKKKGTNAPKLIAVKKRIVRKSAKAATKGAAYAAYVRDHQKAYRTLGVIDSNTLGSVRTIVERVLESRSI